MKLFVVLFVSLVCATAAFGDIKLGGGAPPIEKAIDPIKEAFKKSTGLELIATKYGPKFALQDLEAGKIDAAVLLLTLDEIKSLAKKEGLAIHAEQFQGAVVSRDSVILMVNKENPVSTLSAEQARGIYTGRITSWKEVGGKELPVIVVWSDIVKGINEIFAKKVLGGEAPLKEVLAVGSAADMKNAVATNPEAVALSSLGSLTDTVKLLAEPKIEVPLTIYTKGAPTANVQKLIDYLKSNPGQSAKQR